MKTMTVVALLGTSLLLGGCGRDDHAGHDMAEPEREVLYWYDPMHPEHRFDAPGRSPFMDMDLVPRYADEVGDGRVQVATGVQQAMNLRTARVERGRLWRRIDTVGRVGYDQSTLHHYHARIDGWIEEAHVEAVGDAIAEGDTLFTLYSPDLVNAQEEFVAALRAGDAATVAAGRERLRALDVQPAVITEIERTRRIQRALPWRATADGVVTALGIRHGMFVNPGEALLETADLAAVWVTGEVFDRHSAWLAVGQPVEVAPSYAPGEVREATVAYVYPQLDETTRTVRVRIRLDNADGLWKPGMWTTVRIFGGPVDGVVMIPREALIRTGQAQRVVLREDAIAFRVVPVIAGMESGDWVEVRDGLQPGDEVVVSGQFLLDSEASLRAGHGRLEGAGHLHD